MQVGARWDFLLAELRDPLPLNNKTMKAATLDDETSLPVGLEVAFAGYGTDHHGVSTTYSLVCKGNAYLTLP